MVFQKGFIPWNKGKTNCYSKEVIESNRQKHLGKSLSIEHKQKIALAMQHRRLSEEHKRKIGLNTIKCLTGRKRNPYSEQHRRNISLALKGKSKSEEHKSKLRGENNPMYGIRGENHPSWLGGLKLLPYDKRFNRWFKEEIRKRDNFCCIKCGMFDEDHKKLFKNQSLQIHHINYDKELSIPENCCSLCCRCNAEVNHNRKHWIGFFHSLMNEIYSYNYQEDNILLWVDRGFS